MTINSENKRRMTECQFAWVVLLIAFSLWHQTCYGSGFQGVGDLPGGRFRSASEIVSDDGSVVIGSSEGEGNRFAFRWTHETGIQSLGDLGDLTLGSGSYAHGISADGAVVVGGSGFRVYPFRWTDASGMMPLIEDQGIARGISANGQVVVGKGGHSSSSTGIYLWTEAAGKQTPDIGFLPGADSMSPIGVAQEGAIVVGNSFFSRPIMNSSSTESVPLEPFLWSGDGGLIGLGQLPEHDSAKAHDISPNGSIVVGTSQNYGTADSEAFYWKEANGMKGLGTLAGHTRSSASAVSKDGSVVVGGSGGDEGSSPVIWQLEDGDYQIESFVAFLSSRDIDFSGWQNLVIRDVSADGLTFVGTGRNPDGFTEGWIANVPEPSTLPLASLVGLLCCSRRRQF